MRRRGYRISELPGYVFMLLAPPVALTRLVGWPLPDRAPTAGQWQAWLAEPWTWNTIVAVIAVACWLLWGVYATIAAAEICRWLGRWWRLPRLSMPRPMQAMTAAVLGATAVSAASSAADAAAPVGAAGTVADPLPLGDRQPLGGPVGPVTTRVPGSPPSAPVTKPTAVTRPSIAADDAAETKKDRTFVSTAGRGSAPATFGLYKPTFAGSGAVIYTVEAGDTLWDIADRCLGAGRRWPEIYRLNRDRYDHNGRMRGGDHIEPGWVLRLPPEAAAGAGADEPERKPPAAPPPPRRTSPVPGASDDGIAGPVTPTPTRSAGTPTPSITPPATTPAAPVADRPSAESSPPGVRLPSGGWVDLGLALAVAAAVTVVWRLRRRRYIPRPSTFRLRLDDPDLTPMPAVVAGLRRGLRRQTSAPDASTADVPDDTEDAAWNDNADIESDHADLVSDQRTGSAPAVRVPALDNPMMASWPPAGLGLTGPGAEAAARGLLTAALAAGGVNDPHGCSRVVLPAATLATLLGAAAVTVPNTPRLTVTGDLTEALEVLEEQTLHRTRLVYGHEVDTVAQLRAANPADEPLPPILLLADATGPHQRARVTALLAQGQRLDIHGVLLGPWPDGDTVVVAGDGTTSPADGDGPRHGSHPADMGRLTVLSAGEAAALLATLAESHTGLPQPAAPTVPQPAIPAADTAATPATHPPVDGDDRPTAEPATTPTASAATSPTTPDLAVTGDADHLNDAGRPSGPAARDRRDAGDGDGDGGEDCDGPGVVTVRVLGRPVIVDADPDERLRAKAMELLVYLIARGGDATVDAIVEDLVPDATLSKAPNRIHTYVYALRKALRRTGGPATYITHPRHRYMLNRDAFDVDLWRMQTALAEAENAAGPARVAALRRAVDLYRGEFADGAGYEWAGPYREAIRRQALDAHLALADALPEPSHALAVLDAAIATDPYAEAVYRAAMRRHADLDDVDAIAARLSALTRALNDIDAQPMQETRDLAAALTDNVHRRARRGPGAAA